MYNASWRLTALSASLCAAIVLQACNNKPAPTSTAERIRGTVQSVDGQILTVTTPTGAVRVQVTPTTPVANVVQTDRAHITDGSFLGIGSATGPDGSLRAVEVTVFPESMRGTGEGSYPWDGPGVGGGGTMTNGTAGSMTMTNGTASGSTMTNGTVSSSTMTNGTVSSPANGSSLTLTYQDGSSRGTQTIAIPPDIPVVALEPGTQSDLKPGVHVLVLASRNPQGLLTADRVLAGKNGLVPPM